MTGCLFGGDQVGHLNDPGKWSLLVAEIRYIERGQPPPQDEDKANDSEIPDRGQLLQVIRAQLRGDLGEQLTGDGRDHVIKGVLGSMHAQSEAAIDADDPFDGRIGADLSSKGQNLVLKPVEDDAIS